MSGVRCHMSHFFLFFWQCGGASRWRVCDQRGLPRLVLLDTLQLTQFHMFLKHQWNSNETLVWQGLSYNVQNWSCPAALTQKPQQDWYHFVPGPKGAKGITGQASHWAGWDEHLLIFAPAESLYGQCFGKLKVANKYSGPNISHVCLVYFFQHFFIV